MAKKGKKRQRHKEAAASLECNISSEPALDSLESVLADLEEVTNPAADASAPSHDDESAQDYDDTQAATPSAAVAGIAPAFPLAKPSAASRKEQLSTWDAAFSAWNGSSSSKGGTYTPGLLPCFETELARHFQMQKLSKFLLDACKGDLKMPAFERWLLDSKLEEQQGLTCATTSTASSSWWKPPKKAKTDNNNSHNQTNDPVLPRAPSLTSESGQRLIEEICETGTEKETALQIVKELFARTKAATQEIWSQNLRCVSQAPFKSDRIEIERGSYLVSMLYSRKKWKSPFIVKINHAHYDKLKDRFLNTHANVIRSSDLDTSMKQRTKALHALHLYMMVITLRYSSFSGGQLLDDFRGGGMQGAINEQGFAVLKDYFPQTTLFECFASPLNVSLPMFASAFEELDFHFGSVGSLAQCTEFLDNCCCEANPPFTPGFMEFLADWISLHISKANSDHRALSFVVIVPAVHEQDLKSEKMRVASAVKRFAGRAHQQMVDSSACTRHILLLAKEHGYVEGAQHLRPTRYKRSLYDTSVILLQSKKAQESELDKEAFELDIRKAFAERHSAERQKRIKAKEGQE